MDQGVKQDVIPVLQVGVREFRGNMSAYFRQVAEGASFLIMSRDRVVAELRPPPKMEAPRRIPGRLKGKIWLAADFDETPDDLIDAMEAWED